MKNLIALLLLSGSFNALADFMFYDEPLSILDKEPDNSHENNSSNTKSNEPKTVYDHYCTNGSGMKGEKEPIAWNSNFECKLGYTPQYYYEAWSSQISDLDETNIDADKLHPPLKEDASYLVQQQRYALIAITEQASSKAKPCRLGSREDEKGKKIYAYKCGEDKAHEISVQEIQDFLKGPDVKNKMAQYYYKNGKIASSANNPSFDPKTFLANSSNKSMGGDDGTQGGQNGELTSQENANQNSNKSINSGKGFVSTELTVKTPVTNDKNLISTLPTVKTENEVNVVKEKEKEIIKDQPKENEVPKENVVATEKEKEKVEQKEEAPIQTQQPDVNCSEELKKEIAKLLEDDKKNILGLQYELTVIKMAALAVGNGSKTLEGLIKKKNKEIQKIDQGTLDKMNAMYKKHGLPEDAEKIAKHLKDKSRVADYGPKDKRFFNQDSSAFLLAYQSINKDAGIKDSDVSVLWLFDKVTQKTVSVTGKGSSAYNRSNLSTRIAQYTGMTGGKAFSKDDLEGMSKKLKAKIDKELLGVIENFKNSNKACYDKMGFGEGAEECNLTVLDDSLSQVLAVNSQISSLDLVNVDSHLKGSVNGARFALNRFLDLPGKESTTTVKKEATPKTEVKNEIPVTKQEDVTTQNGPENIDDILYHD